MILQPIIAGKKLPTLTNPGTAADLLTGKQLIDADGNVLTGTMPTQGAQTITPGTAAKTIAAGRYLTGTQTIQGDADLIAANIKSGVNIFGVTGTYGATSEITLVNNTSYQMTYFGCPGIAANVMAGSSVTRSMMVGCLVIVFTSNSNPISASNLSITIEPKTNVGIMDTSGYYVPIRLFNGAAGTSITLTFTYS